jgi:predicted phage-related endonuclease
MTATALVPSPPQERTDHGVGASSAAAAIGVSEYRSRLDAWLEATGRVAGFAGNERTQWGQVLEPVIRAHYVELHAVTVHVPPQSLFHREHSFIRATPDGIVLGVTTAGSTSRRR